MSYIGKSPAVGNFVKLDAITTSSTNTYNLTVDSVAFVPESANHMLVSLNGVIQAPLSSFSVSGSTITFLPASGTLTSSDSIDFIMVYGNVLDIGVPSDSTVTNAKTNFVSTSSSAGLQIKGDGTTDGTLQLNCSQNSHGIKLKSPAHSASASYTLTFPTTDGNADEFLKTDGSGALSWATAGGDMTPAFFAFKSSSTDIGDNTTAKISIDSEVFDTDNCYDNSTNYRFTPTTAGKYYVYAAIDLNLSSVSALVYSWLYIYKNGSEIARQSRDFRFDGYGTGTGNNLTITVDMNGSSDYLEVYAYGDTTSNDNVYIAGNSTSAKTYFGAYKIIT